MPDQFVVPQFLDVEAKIIGPITGRQFAILMVTALLDFIVYRIVLSVIPLIAIGVPILAIGLAFAFLRVNGQPLHYIALNMVQTFRRPFLRVWDKKMTDTEIKDRLKKDDVPPPLPPPQKREVEMSRLSELTLVVNTGGTYAPDDDEVIAGFANPVSVPSQHSSGKK